MNVDLTDFDYDLPESLIAQAPLEQRDESRLMVLSRTSGKIRHCVFRQLPQLLHRGDLLVLNDTQVIPARFQCLRVSGGKLEGLFLSEQAPGRWLAMLKNAGKCRPGEKLALRRAEGVSLELLENLGQGQWRLAVDPPAPALRVLQQAGAPPLPPYIRRADPFAVPADTRQYQTIYAVRPGAVAAPTAGLHFTHPLLAALADAGIATACVTLHVGMGTFLPVKTADLACHRMHREWYELPQSAAAALNAARAEDRRIVAVGTTSARVLETVAAAGGALQPTSGWTDIFIYPPAEFHAVEAMITNFHLPRSTLLMLVAAFCRPGGTDGIRTILTAYAEAVRRRYRFYSYGDAMLID